ncbi:MAG: tRNA uridine-5-carboxymethylaminomethyl(34) synthesis GTPase MnmE [Clostridia bacterium]|nr:tRNA uridine-5-carboxymethylaminomethyl(34) synthesis GTPase MnmE [Clostridia bacterium]
MEKTIAAIATSFGEGGISIIRISGDEAYEIVGKIFVPKSGKPLANRRMTYGKIVDPKTGESVDEVLAVYTKAPHTYTTEDVVEINCHGSVVSQRRILEVVLENGARLAEPGEFTKRAFLNGRLDLSQAEAVIDLIKAKSVKTFDVAMDQLEGRFSTEIKNIRKLILDILVNVTVNIDYPDEDIEQLTYENLEKNLYEVKEEIEKLLSTSDTGRIIKEGLNVAIIGKPNVGKSSLMNALLNEERAIVTDIAGTTRDTIEEMVNIRDIPVKLTDTAGIRDTQDVIEKIGIEKSKASFNSADLVIFVVDSSSPLDEEDDRIISLLEDRQVIVIYNKVDLAEKADLGYIQGKLTKATILKTSLTNNLKGLDQVKDKIVELVYGGKVKQEDSVLVTNVRHKNLLDEGLKSITDAIEMTKMHQALELIEIDINNSYELLGQIIGEAVAEDIINEVFSRFCLGK